MQRVEDELGRALSRREAPPAFTERVMQRVRAETPRKPFRSWRWAAAVGAVAASLLVGAYVGNNRTDRQAQLQAEQQAASQIIDALQLAGAKVEKAREAVLRIQTKEMR